MLGQQDTLILCIHTEPRPLAIKLVFLCGGVSYMQRYVHKNRCYCVIIGHRCVRELMDQHASFLAAFFRTCLLVIMMVVQGT